MTRVSRTADAAISMPAHSLADGRIVLAALPVAVVVVDGSNRFRFANQAAEHFLGLSATQLALLSLGDLIAPDSRLVTLVEEVRRGGAVIHDHDLVLDSPRLSKSGVSVQGVTVPEAPGSVLLAFGDTSAARALDRQLSFRSAARSVSGMAAMLAHEVRNPLSGIRGAAQLLEDGVTGPDRELAVLIRDEVDRIRGLVDRMEEFGDEPMTRAGVNIHRVLGHVHRLARSGFAAGLRIAEAYDPSLPPVWGDRDKLVQVLLNLVKNAAEAIASGPDGEGGEITLATAYRHGLRLVAPGTRRHIHLPLVITVRDNGPGIPDELRPHLFEPFVTGKPSGTGLGLALVAKIIGDHGGLIEVESRPGRTEFRVCLPMLTEDTGETA